MLSQLVVVFFVLIAIAWRSKGVQGKVLFEQIGCNLEKSQFRSCGEMSRLEFTHESIVEEFDGEVHGVPWCVR